MNYGKIFHTIIHFALLKNTWPVARPVEMLFSQLMTARLIYYTNMQMDLNMFYLLVLVSASLLGISHKTVSRVYN